MMGQEEVLKLLEREGEWLSAREVRDKLRCSTGVNSIRKSLQAMCKHREVDVKVAPRRHGGLKWRVRI